MNNNISSKIVQILKNSGLYLLFFLVACIVISSITILMNIEFIKYNFIASLILAIFPYYYITKKDNSFIQSISIIVSFIILFVSIIINHYYIDLSWDGNSYHKDAVGLLKNNWNPIYDDYIDYYKKLNNRNMDYIGDKVELTHGFWQTHYAKSTWHIGATIYAFTKDIETGKIYNLIGVYITFVLTLSAIFKYKNRLIIPIILSLIVAINPISITQTFTYYNDGFMGNMLILLIIYMMIYTLNDDKFNKKELYSIICSLLIILINIKFTGFGYAGLFCLPYFLIFTYKKMKEKKSREVMKNIALFSIVVLFSTCIVGFSPYMTNIIDGNSIFYPLAGENKVDIVSYNEPISFHNKSSLYKFAKSTLSETDNINEISKRTPKLKKIFEVDENQLYVLYAPDIRIAGFGVLFSGILIISSIIITIYIIKMTIKKDKRIIYLITPLIVIALLIIFISESWWARYSPYVYLIPIISLLLTYEDKNKISKIPFLILLIPTLINMSYFIEYNTKSNLTTSIQTKQRLDSMSKNKNYLLIDTNNEFLGMMYNFDDRHINYRVTTTYHNDSKELYKWIKYKEE